MENRKFLNIISYVCIILLAVLARLVPHIPNVAPITGLALFSGAILKNKKFFIIPFAAMFLSDLFLGFHSTMPYVYVSFLLIFFIGKKLHNNSSFQTLLFATLTSSVLFYLITNFGVWQTSLMYTKNTSGLLSAYVLGIPFFKNTVLGDLLFTFGFFYGYRFIFNKYLKALKATKT